MLCVRFLIHLFNFLVKSNKKMVLLENSTGYRSSGTRQVCYFVCSGGEGADPGDGNGAESASGAEIYRNVLRSSVDYSADRRRSGIEPCTRYPQSDPKIRKVGPEEISSGLFHRQNRLFVL